MAGASPHGRHWVKVYDKASILRVETTINNPREFRVLRVFTDEHGRRERHGHRVLTAAINLHDKANLRRIGSNAGSAG